MSRKPSTQVKAGVVSDDTRNMSVLAGVNPPESPVTPVTPAGTKGLKYDTAVTRGKRIMATAGKANWSLGDLAASVETVTYGARTIQRLADDIGTEYKSLLNMRTVSDAYQASDRSENSWTVHMVFAGQEDRTALVSARIWTVSEARAEVAKRNAPAESGPADSGNDGETDGESDSVESEITKTRNNIARLEAELEAARAHLAKLEMFAEPAAPVMHSPRGIPAHAADDPQANCRQCKLAKAA